MNTMSDVRTPSARDVVKARRPRWVFFSTSSARPGS